MTSHPNRSKNVLIPATNHSPAVTLDDIRAAAHSIEALSQMRDIVDNCASQLGRDRCSAAYAEIDRLEAGPFCGD